MNEAITMQEKTTESVPNSNGGLDTEIHKQPSKYAERRSFPLWEGEGPPPAPTVAYDLHMHDQFTQTVVAKRPTKIADKRVFLVGKGAAGPEYTQGLSDLPPIPGDEKNRRYSKEEVGWLLGLSGDDAVSED